MNFPSNSLRKLSLLLAVIGLSQATLPLRADTVIREEFGLKGRTPGRALNNSPVEKGDLVWEASANLAFGDKGSVVAKDFKAFVGRVNLPGAPKTITIEADVHPVPVTSEPNFVGVGIGKPQLGSPIWGGGIYLLIFSNGRYACFYDPQPEDWASKYAVTLQSGQVPEFDTDGKTRLKFQYSPAAKSFSVWINGEQVAQNKKLAADQAVEPEFAGFSGFNQADGKTVATKFVLTLAP